MSTKRSNKNDIEGNPEENIKNRIENFVINNPENRLKHIDNTQIFDKPLVGYADGNDGLFKEYKEIIGDFHLTPQEIFQKLFPDTDPENLSIICWILPITKKTRKSNQKENRVPSLRWAHTRHYGEKFNDSLRSFVVKLLNESGFNAVAPVISDLFETRENTPVGRASTWSERHIQYVAGMGTFGLCDGFITPVGKAMRCGSVVTDLKLKPSERKYDTHTDNCLFLSKSKCGKCIERCPGGAITEKGHDKKKCLEYQQEYIVKPLKEKYQVDILGCGLCQTGVPCELQIPVRPNL